MAPRTALAILDGTTGLEGFKVLWGPSTTTGADETLKMELLKTLLDVYMGTKYARTVDLVIQTLTTLWYSEVGMARAERLLDSQAVNLDALDVSLLFYYGMQLTMGSGHLSRSTKLAHEIHVIILDSLIPKDIAHATRGADSQNH